METLCELEMKYIEKYDTCNVDKGYNKSLGGLGVRQTERSEEHCRNLSKAKMGIDPLRNYTPEQMAKRNAKLSKALRGKNNPRYGMTKDKLEPETLEKLRQAIDYFKEFKGEPVSVNWIYRGINPKYQDRFQYFGYEEDYKKYKEGKALTK